MDFIRQAALFATCLACSCDLSEARLEDYGYAVDEEEGASLDEEQTAPPAERTSLYGSDVMSLRVSRAIAVRAEPRQGAEELGVVSEGTRVAFGRAEAGNDCAYWVEIQPRGWICNDFLEPSTLPPAGDVLPLLDDGDVVPGAYGAVTDRGAATYYSVEGVLAHRRARRLAGLVMVKLVEQIPVGERKFWKTSTGELIEGSAIGRYRPSTFHGVHPGEGGAPPLPLAWVQSRGELTASVATRATARPGSPSVARLKPRTVVPVLETSGDGKAIRIGDGEWVSASDLHVARTTAPPLSVGPGQRWIDIDLDEQVLVAYEGTRPVYATLVSTGKEKHPTPTGVFRIFVKFDETDMNGGMADEQPYSVATVPWTMYFAKDVALHAAYWHNKFGQKRSHGCVNLAPIDARELYYWASPSVPRGWSIVYGRTTAPGSVVRVRDRLDGDLDTWTPPAPGLDLEVPPDAAD